MLDGLERAKNTFPLQFTIRRGLAEAYMRYGPPDDIRVALADVEWALKHDPNSDDLRAVRIVLNYILGNHKLAWEELRLLAQRGPTTIPVRWAIGLLTPAPVNGAVQ